MLGCGGQKLDHRGKRLVIETKKGNITAERAIVTLPTNILAAREDLFAPALPQKVEAAAGLPLGLADKIYLTLLNPEEFGRDTRLFGRTDTQATAAYTLRPQGRPQIEGYFGDGLA